MFGFICWKTAPTVAFLQHFTNCSLGFALVCCCCRFPLPSLLQSSTSVVHFTCVWTACEAFFEVCSFVLVCWCCRFPFLRSLQSSTSVWTVYQGFSVCSVLFMSHRSCYLAVHVGSFSFCLSFIFFSTRPLSPPLRIVSDPVDCIPLPRSLPTHSPIIPTPKLVLCL